MTHSRDNAGRAGGVFVFSLGLMLAVGLAWAQHGQVVQGAPDPGIRLGKSAGGAPTHVCIDSTSSPAWTLMYRLPMYADCPRMDCNVAEDIADRLINIPSSAKLGRQEKYDG